MLTKLETPTAPPVVVQATLRLGIVLFSYCFIAYLVNAAGMDLTRILIGGGDTYTHGLPTKLFATGFSAWNPWVQLGVYSFGNTEYSPFYLPALIPVMLFHNVFGYNLFTLSQYPMAAFFFFLYARNLRLGDYAAYVGGLLFMCSGFMLGHKGHQALLGAAIWLPLLLLFLDRYVRTRLLKEAAFAGATLGMSLLGGFPQTTTYMTVLAIAYFSFRCFGEDSDSRMNARLPVWATGLAAMGVVAVLIASLQLFAAAELIPTITREKISLEMFSQDSLPLPYIGALLVPGIFGGTSGLDCYFRRGSFVEFYSYMGQFVLLLAAFAAIGLWRRNSAIRFWVLAGSMAGILCLGLTPLQRILHVVPVYNLFRAPARHLYEVNFALCMLAVYGLHAILNNVLQRRQVVRALLLGGGAIGMVLAAAVYLSQYIRFLAEHPSDTGFGGLARSFGDESQSFSLMAPTIYDHLALWRPTVLLPVIFFAISAYLLWQMSKRTRTLWKVLVPIAMVLDIWLPYSTVYRNPDTTPLFHPPSDSDAAYLNSLDRTHYRIYPVDPVTLYVYPMLSQVNRLPTINDYSPFWDKRYQSIGQFNLNGQSSTAYMAPKLMDELGVRYLVTNRSTIAEQLRHISELSDPPAAPLPIPDLNCAALNCSEAWFPGSGIISLEHHSGPAAIIKIPVAFTPNTLYKIAFDVRVQGVATAPLSVDLDARAEGWGGSSVAHRREIMSLGPGFTPTDILISSVHMAAQNGYIRLFTISSTPIEIRNLHIGIAQPVASAYREAYGAPNGDVIFENPGGLPRFRFAREILPVSNAAEARAITLSAPFDPALQATVEGADARKILDEGKVLSESIANEKMDWTVATGAHSLFLVADTWFPGWKARVDGQDAPIRIVNGFLRGVFINGSGTHQVNMEFHPWAPRYGAGATLAGILLLIGCCFVRRPIGPSGH
jgi:hypothetical protein